MGGSGGGITSGSGEIPIEPDACEKLHIETNLMSPQSEPMKSVRVGDVLRVDLRHTQEHRYVIAVDASGQVVGTIGSDRAISLIECMDKGYVYVADVRSVEGGACRVIVHQEAR